MNRFLRFLLFCLVPVFIFSSTASAQKIGLVNSQRILIEYQDAIETGKKIQAERQKMAEGLNRLRTQVDSLYTEFQAKQMIWSEKKKKDTEDHIRILYDQFQREQQAKFGQQGEFERLQANLMKPVTDKIRKAIDLVGKENGYDFIFDTVANNVVYAKEGQFDITDLILEKLKK